MSNIYQIYLISDSTGETLDRIFTAIKAQFKNINYKKNKYNEIGRYVKKEFDYNSLTNPEYIDSKTLKKIIYHAD